jgi:hypothetical protein
MSRNTTFKGPQVATLVDFMLWIGKGRGFYHIDAYMPKEKIERWTFVKVLKEIVMGRVFYALERREK